MPFSLFEMDSCSGSKIKIILKNSISFQIGFQLHLTC